MLRFSKYSLNAVFTVAYLKKQERGKRMLLHKINSGRTHLASMVCADQFAYSCRFPSISTWIPWLLGVLSAVLIEKFKRVLSKKGVSGTGDRG